MSIIPDWTNLFVDEDDFEKFISSCLRLVKEFFSHKSSNQSYSHTAV